MRIFKSRWFAKFARKKRIDDARLCEAVRNVEQGMIDADYGGGLIKQRIARPDEGKSGGYRAILLFRKEERVFFVYGFAKNDQSNIDASDERDFKELAQVLLHASDPELDHLVAAGKYTEMECHDQTEEQHDQAIGLQE